jgi:hypothetical protein
MISTILEVTNLLPLLQGAEEALLLLPLLRENEGRKTTQPAVENFVIC